MATRKTSSSTGSGKSRAPSGPAAAAAQAAPGAPADSLGVRLKHARMVHQLTLKALAEQAGCSESLLSKVESGRATPSLATLHRLALALSTNIAALVSGPDVNTSAIQRANERPSVSFPTAGKRGSIKLERVVVPAPGQLLQGDIHVIEPHTSSDEQISHLGEELGYVIEGELELTLDQERHLLQPGDSFYFPSNVPHSYRNPGKVVTRVFWVNTPPTF
ncbi:cupin domain-containing protein [Paraburkholderia bannensis]|uniref:cupin domain-containing protein n=1 Tax=Paraburkholderia bannensis TaxID=765414 RepID=UPI000AFEFF96|nr:cupin domain-containing protein [Paraburkholderia bannensis]